MLQENDPISARFTFELVRMGPADNICQKSGCADGFVASELVHFQLQVLRKKFP